MENKNIEENIEENIDEVEKEVGRLSAFILENRKTVTTIGIGLGLYLLGKRKGHSVGYVRGYEKCFNDIIDAASDKSR